jgi:ATP-binding cassette subfamily B protein
VAGSQFFILIGLVGAVGTALVYWVGGHMVLNGEFTIGTIVAFSSYLTRLYGVLQQLTNAPVAFATSMVSFERVFEVIDLPLDIEEKPDAYVLQDVRGELTFENVSRGTGKLTWCKLCYPAIGPATAKPLTVIAGMAAHPHTMKQATT